MLKKLYDAISNDAHAKEVAIAGRNYTTKKLHPVLEPTVSTFNVQTLTGLVDYIKTNVDKLNQKDLILHIKNPQQVVLMSKFETSFKERNFYIEANLDQIKIPFDKYLDAEQFNILLQSCFVDDPIIDSANICDTKLITTHKGLLLSYTANVTSTIEAGYNDDGVTQTVTARTGVACVEKVILPNPVNLRPFRTFTEVEQPVSSFVFRAKQNDANVVFMLVEADGGAWRSKAMKSIKEFFEFEIPEIAILA